MFGEMNIDNARSNDSPSGLTELIMPSIYRDNGLPLVNRSTKVEENSESPVIFSWWNPVMLSLYTQEILTGSPS